MSVKLNVKGERYGRLVGIKCMGSQKGHTTWLWRCDCGNEKEINLVNVRRGLVKSCGCYAQECRTKHGLSTHWLYTTYRSILGRCNNKNYLRYVDYGGRGISCCFNSFDEFYAYVTQLPNYAIAQKKKLTINRIDNNGNYETGNLEWASQARQEANKRMNKNNTSGCKGVSFYKRDDRWVARLSINGVKNPVLGYFKTKEEAIEVRKKAEQEYRSTILY